VDSLPFRQGIDAQPAALAKSRVAVSASLRNLPDLGSGMVALVGIGASARAALSAAIGWRHAGLNAFPVSAPELSAAGPGSADVVVAISLSGRSAETVSAVRALKGIPTVGVTNDPGSPLADAVHTVLDLGCGKDSRASTVGYTSTLQALGLIGDYWSSHDSDWAALPDLVAGALEVNKTAVETAAQNLRDAVAVDVIAGAQSLASAGEGALLLREGARLFTSAHETRDYLHGPIEALEPARVGCVVIGDGREVELASTTSLQGCPTLLVTSLGGPRPVDHLTVARLPGIAGLPAIVLEVLPLQQLTSALALARGLTVESFRHHQDDTKLP
jgi:fructoselysine-6-P-deglycase FrlB-like protein